MNIFVRPSSFLTDGKILYISQLIVGFETNIQNDSDRKASKYSTLINDLSPSYSKVGVMGPSCSSLSTLLHDLHFDKIIQKRIIMKAMNISIRSSYYIFCRQNKPWNNPELLTIQSAPVLYLLTFFLCSMSCICMHSTSEPILHCHVLERCILVISYIYIFIYIQ